MNYTLEDIKVGRCFRIGAAYLLVIDLDPEKYQIDNTRFVVSYYYSNHYGRFVRMTRRTDAFLHIINSGDSPLSIYPIGTNYK